MFRIIQLFFLLSTIISANEQIILVIADDFNSTKAKLYTFEKKDARYHKVFETFDVNLGRNGLGWGIGIADIKHNKNSPVKYEGDGRAPAGVFFLGSAFGYKKRLNTDLKYIYADKDLICIDDSSNKNYNKILHVKDKSEIESFEYMRRDDNLYEMGIVVKHNTQSVAKRGSCIFLHIQKSEDSPTSGCTSMSKENLLKLIEWLDIDKEPLLIQLPKDIVKSVLEDMKVDIKLY